jgi:hypothetical protein
MSFRPWQSVRRLVSYLVREDRRTARRSAARRRTHRPQVEHLEDRTVPTFSVDSTLNFTGLTGTDFKSFHSGSLFAPPDSMGAIGPNHYVEFINGVFAIYNKSTGTLITGSKVSDSTFWKSTVGISNTFTDPGLSDPRIIYDPASQRWFALEINIASTLNGTNNNSVLLGISATSDPTGTWKGVTFLADSGFGDFPTLGLDANAVYIGTNDFSDNTPTGSLTGVSLFSIPKTDLTASTPTLADMTPNRDISIPIPPPNPPPQVGFALQGATDFGSSTHGTIIAIDAYLSSTIDRYTVTNPGLPGASLSGPTQISVATTSPTPAAQQPDGQTPDLDTGGTRFSSSVYQVGNLLYMAHTTGFNGRSAIRWTILNETTNAVVTEGTISDPNFDFFYPSIAANAAGNVVIGYNRSGGGAGNFISSYASGGTLSGSTLTLDAPLLLHAGTVNYHLYVGGVNRWGDYSAVQVDPSDPTKFWTVQEFPDVDKNDGKTIWSTQITRLNWSPPATSSYTAPAGGPNQILLHQNGSNVEIVNNGIVVATQPLLSTSSVTITGGDNASNTLTIDYTGSSGSFQTLPVTFTGGGGTATNKLIAPNITNTWNVTTNNAGNINGVITFSGVQNLQGGTGSDSFVLSNGVSVSGTISGGGGTDTLDYSHYTTAISVNLQTGAATNLNGGAAGGFANIGTFIGGSAADTLTGPNTNTTWTLGPSNDAGNLNSNTFTFSSFQNLQGGTANDTFVFGNGVVISGSINGGAGGTDTLDYSLYATAISVNLQTRAATGISNGTAGGFGDFEVFKGGAAADTLTGQNSNTTWSLGPNDDAGNLNNNTFTFSSFQNLQGGTANDTLVFSPGKVITGSINGGGGTNTLDYSAYITNVSVNLQARSATGIANGTGGGYGNITTFKGGSGSNTLTGQNSTSTWSITGNNAGNINSSTFIFSAFQNLMGGTGRDSFAFSDGKSLSGTLNGGGGGDWLDYSAYMTSVTVNLTTNAATGVDGGVSNGISNIQNVHGGNGGNNLTGNSTPNNTVGNILIGGSGTNTITGGNARSILIADAGTSTITAGSDGLPGGGDILIGGTTSFDTMTTANQAALASILAEWQSSNSYTLRFQHINGVMSGGLNGTNLLHFGTTLSDTVKDNGKANVLNGTMGHTTAVDWFFGSGQTAINNILHNQEYLNNALSP